MMGQDVWSGQLVSCNPATGEVLGRYPVFDPQKIQVCIRQVKERFQEYRWIPLLSCPVLIWRRQPPQRFAQLKVGDPDVGPLATLSILQEVDGQVQALVQAGAKVWVGGSPLGAISIC